MSSWLKAGKAFIMQSVLATGLAAGKPEAGMAAQEWEINDKKALLAIKKA